MPTIPQPYAKSFIPLESDPCVFNDLMYDLGVSQTLSFVDILSIYDPNILSVVPRPAHALILVLPTSDEYGHRFATAAPAEITEEVIWLRQTIDNACGLYALLHAVCNSSTRSFIDPASFLHELTTLPPHHRSTFLTSSSDLENWYRKAALRGSTSPPPAEDEVDLHYVCFVRSLDGEVWELDGDANGPVKTGVVLKESEDMLDEAGLECVKGCIARGGEDVSFSLLALVENRGDEE